MVRDRSTGKILFDLVNYILLAFVSICCVLPLIHVIAVSFSASAPATAGMVLFWPVDFTLSSYKYILDNDAFLSSFLVSLQRVGIGLFVNMLLTVMIAYPLSKEVSKFRYRTFYAWFFVTTMFLSGGLIPTYMIVMQTGLMDTIWALILPHAVPIFNVVLLLNFFRALPNDLYESAVIDGANHWVVMWKIYVPVSIPALATIGLFATVGHWNAWFDGLIYMNSPDNYPLQSYLRTVLVDKNLSMVVSTNLEMLKEISERTTKAAQIVIAAVPILILYPFLQRYFMHGIVLGSVKE